MSKIKGVSIDSAVTTDIHRIFRLPNTLHGETGFVKCQCDLDNFNPFQFKISFVMKGTILIYVDYITSYLKANFNHNFVLISFWIEKKIVSS